MRRRARLGGPPGFAPLYLAYTFTGMTINGVPACASQATAFSCLPSFAVCNPNFAASTKLLTGCVSLWSGAVVASAKAQTFPQLLIAGSLVGAGEAGLIPIGFAMIPELFRGRRRQVANSIFSGALLLSSAIAFALCGQLISRIKLARHALPIGLQTLDVWRLSFFAAALPAPLMLLLIGTISLPRSVAVKDVESARLTNNSLTSYLRQHRSTFLTFYLGNGFSLVGLC